MIDIEELKPLIVERLKPLNPDKIILFGSYAYGTPTEESDIDLFLVKNIQRERARDFIVESQMKIKDLMSKYKIGFDILVASSTFIKNREDYFYKHELLEKGIVIYE